MTTEFKSSVESGNLLRTRIMLKDSFVTDPTCVQLDALLSYAKEKLPGIIVPYDGDALEKDSSKWNLAVMNLELVQLVNNFSQERIDHLKKVVGTVKREEIQKMKAMRSNELMVDSFKKIRAGASQINRQLKKVNDNNHKWKSEDIKAIECAAEDILAAVQQYKSNK
ncbi:hypothetical protein [Gemmiger formicilis]|uniref:hypothetical protein n=1 Tax=Gemmiger formicilis TaxID=745368 RepID=UPI00241C47C8|nr:hypothetical protein [Gemmiger formicilis]